MNRQELKTNYFINLIKSTAELSTCIRRKVGAVLVKDGIILATGYNGNPRSIKHCDELGCIREVNNVPSGERQEFCTGLHAEQNAILQCAIKQTNPEGASLYCTTFPCVTCAKLLIQIKIKEIYFLETYNDALSKVLLNKACISQFNLTSGESIKYI